MRAHKKWLGVGVIITGLVVIIGWREILLREQRTEVTYKVVGKMWERSVCIERSESQGDRAFLYSIPDETEWKEDREVQLSGLETDDRELMPEWPDAFIWFGEREKRDLPPQRDWIEFHPSDGKLGERFLYVCGSEIEWNAFVRGSAYTFNQLKKLTGRERIKLTYPKHAVN